MKTRKIIYVTGTRSEYGLMREVLKKLHAARDIDLSICVTGMHLSRMYGETVKEIEADAFRICGTIPVDVDQATHASMAKAIGYELLGMVELFEKEQPDLVLVLGDRGEMLAAALSAVHLNIPIVHLHGGERSGTVDEMVRHCISKLSHYHFTATEEGRKRLIKMGEKEEHVFVVGAPGLDEFYQYTPCESQQFYQSYQFDPDRKVALLIYHPVVQEYEEMERQTREVIEAGLSCKLQIICLEPNSDAGGQLIRKVLQDYKNHPDLRIVTHLPRAQFIDCLAHCDLMFGNSSSGIIEAASFNRVAVNVGSRQNLREYGENVIHVNHTLKAIVQGLNEALQRSNRTYKNIYGDGGTSNTCYHLLKSLSLDPKILNKSNAY